MVTCVFGVKHFYFCFIYDFVFNVVALNNWFNLKTLRSVYLDRFNKTQETCIITGSNYKLKLAFCIINKL